MGETTGIKWTDHTHNEWIGCAHVSPGCENCYAENLMAGRYKRVTWGPGQDRALTSAGNRREPLAWNRKAIAEGVRRRVFSASLSDWLDHEVPAEWLTGLLSTVAATPGLDWLLLSKRIQRFRERLSDVVAWAADIPKGEVTIEDMRAASLASDWLDGIPPANVWLGVTVEDQRRADERVPFLQAIPAVVHFLSVEPLLEAVDLGEAGMRGCYHPTPGNPERFPDWDHDEACAPTGLWVIVGGESQSGCRPMDPDWARAVLAQTRDAHGAFFMKQMGGHPSPRKELDDLPPDLRIREFPVPRSVDRVMGRA